MEVTYAENSASCRLSAIIFRITDDERYFNSHAIYYFNLIYDENFTWKIKKIKQIILWNEGDPKIHKKIKSS